MLSSFQFSKILSDLIFFLIYQPYNSLFKHESARMKLLSPDFKNGENIPQKYTCDGINISPTLQWTNVPAETKSLALIFNDAPKNNGFVYWIVFNISPKLSHLDAGVEMNRLKGVRTGSNSGGKQYYQGSCPLRESGIHTYQFHLYALDTILHLHQGATKEQLLQAMEGHILKIAGLQGTYQR